MEPVRIAVIGAGVRGSQVYGQYALDFPFEAVVVAVAEPDQERRSLMATRHGIPRESAFADWNDLLRIPPVADAVLVTTQDRMHVDPVIRALERGYHVLVEKPLATTPVDIALLANAVDASDRIVAVGHVLRYTAFFLRIHQLISAGAIGRVMSIQHNENVGYRHFAHSYVRGNWANTTASSPMILAKSCHDLDILVWLAGSPTRQLSSFGSLSYFTEEHAPTGAPARCTDGCPHAASCPYYAPRIYLGSNTDWPVSTIAVDTSLESRRRAVETGPYGRCVFHSDNDAVDHQVVSVEFENGVTAVFSMTAFNAEGNRTIKVMGTEGEIHGNMNKNEIRVTPFSGDVERVFQVGPPQHGHREGDYNLFRCFLQMVRSGNQRTNRTSVDESLESHYMAFAAEESRRTGETISLPEFSGAFIDRGVSTRKI